MKKWETLLHMQMTRETELHYSLLFAHLEKNRGVWRSPIPLTSSSRKRNYVFKIKNKFKNQIRFTLYLAHSRVGRGNLFLLLLEVLEALHVEWRNQNEEMKI